MTRRLCLSLAGTSVEAIRRAANAAPPEIDLVELRLDRLDPAAWSGSSWEGLPGAGTRDWVATWRDPREGGHAPRPRGILERALAAGFLAVDVEAAALEAGDAEARAVPPARRWVSRHLESEPADTAALRDAWSRVTVHEGCLHKLVVPAVSFGINAGVVDLAAAESARRAVSIFAQGWTGHVSRVLGHLRGNAVTYVSGELGETAAGQPTLEQALRVYDLPSRRPTDAVYGVVGTQVRRSGSPALHNAWFHAHGFGAVYVPLETADPVPVLEWLRTGRLAGVSVTVPFKETVMQHLDTIDPVAVRLGAVNTVVREPDGRLRGSNTDTTAAAGVLADFPAGAVALLGAGGAARAVAGAARDAGREVTVFNRDPERGRAMASAFGARWGGGLERLDPAAFAVLVNATPLGAQATLPEAFSRRDLRNTAVLDLAYGPRPTALESMARAAGVPWTGGRDFLARQAAEQFALWTGRRPPLPGSGPTRVAERGER